MSTVTSTRTVVIVGTRPRVAPAEVLGDLRPGETAAVFVLGLDPSADQRRFTDDAFAIATERQLVLTAELVPATSWLEERLREGDDVRIAARPREARRWRIEPSTYLTARGA
jgi:hypothetical protein